MRRHEADPLGQRSFTISARHNGPPRSANGGWASGLVAEAALSLSGAVDTNVPVRVRLMQPPPLEEQITVAAADGRVTATARNAAAPHEPVTIATAELVPGDDLTPLPAVTVDEAAAAARRFDGGGHPFPTCYVCGPGRSDQDGMRLFPGPCLDDDGQPTPHHVAAPLVPTRAHAEAGSVAVWAALDCPGAWASGVTGQPMVLGTITARVERALTAGEPHVVTAEALGREGRKHYAATTVRTGDGALVGTARQIWIAI